MGLKDVAKRLARSMGVEIRRVKPPGPTIAQWTLDPTEAAELDARLLSFARLHPYDCEPWSKPERARTYLTPKRIASYHDLLSTCARQGIAFDGRSVADVGSGTGYLLRLIHAAAPSASLAGFDTYREITELARHLCPAACFHERDLFSLDGQDLGAFDVVICMEVLEHMIDPEEALRQLLRMATPGGQLLLTVPNGRNDTFPPLEPYPNGTGYWGHINFWSPESWRLWLARNLGGRTLCCGSLATGENYAIVQTTPSQGDVAAG